MRCWGDAFSQVLEKACLHINLLLPCPISYDHSAVSANLKTNWKGDHWPWNHWQLIYHNSVYKKWDLDLYRILKVIWSSLFLYCKWLIIVMFLFIHLIIMCIKGLYILFRVELKSQLLNCYVLIKINSQENNVRW